MAVVNDDGSLMIDGLHVIHRDECFLLVNKPFGLRSVPAFEFKQSVELNPDISPKEPKKRKRQERFSDILESLAGGAEKGGEDEEHDRDTKGLKPYLKKLGKEHSSVPRKRNKFISYAKRSLRMESDAVINELFDYIEKKVKDEEEKEGASLTDSVLTRIQRSVAASATAVHRLDMETSGLLLVALTREAGQELNRQFRDREVSKTYVAVVEGHVKDNSGSIELPLRPDLHQRPKQVVDSVNGKSAHTKWKVRTRSHSESTSSSQASSSSLPSSFRSTSLLELTPITGRTHQLRVHLQAIGHPIVGDTLYNDHYSDKAIVESEDSCSDRLKLHAEQIRFKHPITRVDMEFIATSGFT